jgi:DNA mismatch endonuclease, patch repair protein
MAENRVTLAPPSSPHATATMRANRGRDTAPEIALRSALHRRGFRFRKNLRFDVEGLRLRPDVVFTRAKVAVFLDGCYWHGCPSHGQVPVANRDFWTAKIQANRDRDQRQTAALERAGWLVVRVWEHEEISTAVDRVDAAVASRQVVGAARTATLKRRWTRRIAGHCCSMENAPEPALSDLDLQLR